MTDYPFGIQLAVAPLDENNVIRDGEIWIYAPTDTNGTSPLQLTDLSGLPMVNPLRSNAFGYTRPFIANIPQVKWKSGIHEGLFDSFTGMWDETVAAKMAAQEAAHNAAAAATDELAARIDAGDFVGPAGPLTNFTIGTVETVGSSPLDDDIISSGVLNGAKTKAALNATYVPKWKANTAYLAGDAVLSPGGDTVTAKANFTAAASFNAANWNYSASYASPTTVNLAAARRSRNRVGICLDSISDQNAIVESGSMGWAARGYFTWANVYLGGRLEMVWASSFGDEWGVSGLTAATFLSSGEADLMAAADMDIAVVLGGTNDIVNSGATAAGAVASLTAIWDKLLAKGKTVVACTITPRNLGSATTIDQTIRDANVLIRKEALARRGVVICDWHSAVIDPTTSLGKPSYYADTLHFTAAGAARLGRVLADTLDKLTYTVDLPGRLNGDTKNLIANPLMTGTTGTKPTGYTGEVAVGGTVTKNGAGAGTCSIVPRSDLKPGNWQQIVATATDVTLDGFSYDMRNTAAGVDWNVGDTVRGIVEFETDAAGWDCREISGKLRCQTPLFGQILQTVTTDRTGATVALLRPGYGVMVSPPLVIPTGTTRLQMDFNFYGAGTVRIGGFRIEKL